MQINNNFLQLDFNTRLLVSGDNLKLLKLLYLYKQENKDFGINLIYIDPPFNTGKKFKDKDKKLLYNDNMQLQQYLIFLYKRLLLLKQILVDNGAIYVHLDWHAVHYIKVIMDEIFGIDNFINQIIWFYGSAGNGKKRYLPKHDTILYYVKDKDNYVFNADLIRIPFSKNSKYKIDQDGRIFKYWNKGKKYYPPQDLINGKWTLKGKYRYDVIDDVCSMVTVHNENYLFVSQKREQLIKIFILASSNENDIVLDCFAGSGTTLAVAEKLNRRWIGCQINNETIQIIKNRLLNLQYSKDLINNKLKYNKKCRQFNIVEV